MAGSETECTHCEWQYEFERNRWLSLKHKSIPSAVEVCWCRECGELRFREGDRWVQRYWTAEDIKEIDARSKELYDCLFGEDDDRPKAKS